MVSNGKRRIKDGKEFDHLFPPPSEQDIVIKKSANVEDTLKLIRSALPKTLWQTQKIAKVLKGKTLDETCSNIWHFVYNHIQYKRDEDGVEQVRSPRRTWWDRKTGVDCDCYTVFILSMLRSLNIDCLARVTKYKKKFPEVPRWQHIYPIVPKPGHLEDYLDEREHYIVIDCVKDNYNDEQPYLESIDYYMRLDYLDGFDDEGQREEEGYDEVFREFDLETVEAREIAALYGDDLGFLKKLVKKVGGAVKKIGDKVGGAIKTVAKDIKKTVPVLVKKIGDDIGKGVRFLNRYLNPATILLRNGFLLAMKVNLFNVGGRLRYAYLTDAQAKERGINLDNLNKLRKVKDKAETVYWQAGGKKENLKKGILKGKGNKNNKVPLSGLFGFDDNVYADLDEYNIIHSDPDTLEGLGEIASGTAIAAATGAVSAIAAALKQIKGLFNKGGSDEQAFQSETDNAGDASSASATISEDEDKLVEDYTAYDVPQSYSQPSTQYATPNYATPPASLVPGYATPADATLPAPSSADRRMPGETIPTTTNNQVPTPADNAKSQGFMEKSITWVKENPAQTLLIAGALAGGGYFLTKVLAGSKNNTNGLSGVHSKRKRKKKKGRKHHHKIQSIKL